MSGTPDAIAAAITDARDRTEDTKRLVFDVTETDGGAASAPKSCAFSSSESHRREMYTNRTVLAPDGFPLLKTEESRHEVYSCGMYTAADMLLEMHRGSDVLKIKTPAPLKRMIVAVGRVRGKRWKQWVR
jgi:hypothetical protein